MVLLAASLLSLAPSVRPDYSGTKFWGIIFGLAVFSACLNTCGTASTRRFAGVAFLVAGAVATVPAVLHMQQPVAKFLPSEVLYAILNQAPGGPEPVQSSTIVIQGINANEVGGMLTLLVPLAIMLSVGGGWLRLVAIPAGLILAAALVLTQSRAAMGGIVIALTVGALWAVGRRSKVAVAVGLALVVSAAAGLASFQPQLFALNLREAPLQAGVFMLADMPLTGIGLNTFTEIQPRFYPAPQEDGPTYYAHTHNLFLQTWLDLGVLGLVAFLAIVALAVRAGLRPTDRDAPAAVSHPGDWPRTVDHWVTIGLLLSLLAQAIYGLADAVTLGAKPSAALWAVLGLLVARSSASTPFSIEARLGSALAKTKEAPLAWPRAAQIGTLMVLLVLAIPPFSVNAARLVLHHVEASGAPATLEVGALLDADLEVGGRLAWGPYQARIDAARSLLAEVRQRPPP